MATVEELQRRIQQLEARMTEAEDQVLGFVVESHHFHAGSHPHCSPYVDKFFFGLAVHCTWVCCQTLPDPARPSRPPCQTLQTTSRSGGSL